MLIRSPDPDGDFEEVLALVQACDRAVYGDSDWTADELREEWDGLDLERGARVAVVEGRIAGVMHCFGEQGGIVRVDGYVHPELTGRGVGFRLLAAAESRAAELAAGSDVAVPVSIETAHLVGDPRAPKLLACRGYVRLRTYFRMVVELEPGHPQPRLPDGLELRPFDPELHGPEVQAVLDDAFAHEWGYEPLPYDEWAQQFLGGGRFDPGLCPVAWDGDRVAAVSLNYAKRNGDWGFIRMLGVRSAWRRHGLGLALLHESFRRFEATGETTVALGVDSENPTGATRLYERAGMRVLWRADVWRKELAAAAASAG